MSEHIISGLATEVRPGPLVQDEPNSNSSENSESFGKIDGEFKFDDSDENSESEDAEEVSRRKQQRTILIAYGSETGIALDLAEELVDLTRRLGFFVILAELNEVPPQSFRNYTLVLIVTSTHGDGNVPYNAREFWEKLKGQASLGHGLPGVRYAMYGVGDSKYEKFNWASSMIDLALKHTGAKSLISLEEYGKGDVEDSFEEHFDSFKGLLVEVLSKDYPLPQHVPIPVDMRVSEDTQLCPYWALAFDKPAPSSYVPRPVVEDRVPGSPASWSGMPVDEDSIPIKGSMKLVVLKNQCMTVPGPLSDQVAVKDVRHIVFEKEGASVNYGPMDVLSILPKNLVTDVDSLLEQQDWFKIRNKPVKFIRTVTADEPLDRKYPDAPIKNPLNYPFFTIQKLLTHYLDFNGTPKRSFFRKISEFAQDPPEKTRLLDMGRPDFVDVYQKYAQQLHRGMLDVLRDFPSVRIPWEYIVDVFPPMRPRDFSIASGGILKTDSTGSKTRFDLAVDLVSYETLRTARRGGPLIWKQGVCSKYLACRLEGSKIDAVLKRTQWKIQPRHVRDSALMVSIGTGIAPIRSLLYEFELFARTFRPTDNLPPPIQHMIQGHHTPTRDFLFGDEWDRNIKPTIPLLTTAAVFSRNDAGEKQPYVQTVLSKDHEQTGNRVFNALAKNQGYMYICGKAGKFTEAVEDAVVENFQAAGMDEDVAKLIIRRMKKEGRWRLEVWG